MRLLTALFLIFLTLKILGVITWSWAHVFLPLIIEAILILFMIVATVFVVFLKQKGRWRYDKILLLKYNRLHRWILFQ